jgi:hypothetical protein
MFGTGAGGAIVETLVDGTPTWGAIPDWEPPHRVALSRHAGAPPAGASRWRRGSALARNVRFQRTGEAGGAVMGPGRLRHVYWLGGGSGAGKSTIARRLAARHGLRLYSTDAVMPDHGRRIAPAAAPYLREFAAMDMDERWLNRTPATMLDTFHWFRGEGFGLIVEDLLRLPADPVVAEGFRLLPRLVGPLAAPGHAVWLAPAPAFRRAAFESRGSLLAIAGRTSDPDRALRNLLERDRLFTERVRAEATELGLPVIDVDTGVSEDELTWRVAAAFGLA